MDSNFLYHYIPDGMRGTILYPLNQLKEIYPDSYSEHAKKYQNRPELLETKIPTLNCLWNDVLHLTAVPPQDLMKALASAGFKGNKPWNGWYKIPASKLDPTKTTALEYDTKSETVAGGRHFLSFDPRKLSQYAQIPPETIAYYKQKISVREKPLMFHFIPHVLYKGTLDTTGLEIIKVVT